MFLDTAIHLVNDSAIGKTIREQGQLFPWIESVHVLAITLVVGSISVVDLRLLGVASKRRPISEVTRQVLPLTWCAFAVAVTTGALLFSAHAVKYSHNIFFLSKMALLVSAGFNMIIFHVITARGMATWDTARRPPTPVVLAGAMSLALWAAVIVCGRWIGFTMDAFQAGGFGPGS
jgi:hypothetical protein